MNPSASVLRLIKESNCQWLGTPNSGPGVLSDLEGGSITNLSLSRALDNRPW